MTKIAHDNHISLQELERINPQISNPNFIYSGDVVNLPTKSTTNGYTWNPSLIQEPSTPPPVTTYGVTPTPMTANENNTENFPNNASSQLRYQPNIVQPDATSHASLAPQNVPSEASNSDIPNIKDLSEGLESFPTMGEAVSTIVGDEKLVKKFKIGGDVITGATDAYSLFTANSIDEKNKAFGNTAEDLAKWWARREIPYVGEGLLVYDVGNLLYTGIKDDLIPESRKIAYYDALNRYETEYKINPLSKDCEYWYNRVKELEKYADYEHPTKAKFEPYNPNRFTDNPDGR